MDPETQQILQERFAELPENLRVFIRRPQVKSSIRIIAEKHHLPEDKAILLENEVMLVLLGFDAIEDFEERVMAELYIPGSAARSVSNDMRDMVFKEVEQDLKEIIDKQHEAEREQVSATPQATSVPPIPKAPLGPPAWSQKTGSQGQAPENLPSAPEIPSYKRPMTDTPRYVREDPYREPPK